MTTIDAGPRPSGADSGQPRRESEPKDNPRSTRNKRADRRPTQPPATVAVTAEAPDLPPFGVSGLSVNNEPATRDPYADTLSWGSSSQRDRGDRRDQLQPDAPAADVSIAVQTEPSQPEPTGRRLPPRVRKLARTFTTGVMAAALALGAAAEARNNTPPPPQRPGPIPAPEYARTAPEPLTQTVDRSAILSSTGTPTMTNLTNYVAQEYFDRNFMINENTVRDMLDHVHGQLNTHGLDGEEVTGLNDVYLQRLFLEIQNYYQHKNGYLENIPATELEGIFTIFDKRPENITDAEYETRKQQAAKDILKYLQEKYIDIDPDLDNNTATVRRP